MPAPDFWQPKYDNPYGSLLSFFYGETPTASLADSAAMIVAWGAMTVSADSNFATYPDAFPNDGAVTTFGNTKLWTPTVPALYKVTATTRVAFTAAPSSTQAGVQTQRLASNAMVLSRGVPVEVRKRDASAGPVDHVFSDLYPVSQGMIDEGLAGVICPPPGYLTNGTERANFLSLTVTIERFNLGAPSSYAAAL